METKRIRYILFWLFFAGNIFVTSLSYGQFFSLGNDPGRAVWRYYKSRDFRVIYPAEADSIAKRYIWLLHELKPYVTKTINAEPRRIDVVLHPYTVMSNGMVGVAPRRMELFTTPSFTDDYVDSWEKHLVIHELRHVGQISKFEKGVFRPLRWIAGEQAVAAGVGLYMSQWTLEGDAVVSETEFTSAGRGRDPDHLVYYRAAFLNGDYRTWDRWTLGSYRDYVPDIYSFGYLFSSFVRYRSGNPYYLGEVTDYVISRFYDVNAQNRGYRKFTGLDKKENFEELKRYYTRRWEREDSLRAPFTNSEPVTSSVDNSEAGFYSYLYPMWTGERVYAIKKDFDNISRLISVSEGEDEFVHRFMGNLSSVPVRQGTKIFWTEYISSPRWELEVFSDLFSYDIRTGNTERLTYGERLFYPSFGEQIRDFREGYNSREGDFKDKNGAMGYEDRDVGVDGRWSEDVDRRESTEESAHLVVASYSVDGNTSVAGYTLNGDKLFEYAPPAGYRIKEAVADTDHGYYVLLVKEGGSTLFRLESQSSHGDSTVRDGSARWRLLADMDGKSMSDIKLYDRRACVTFISDYDGVKNLYGYDVANGQVIKLTNMRFGISGYDFNEEGRLVVSDFSQRGYSLRVIEGDDISFEKATVLLNRESKESSVSGVVENSVNGVVTGSVRGVVTGSVRGVVTGSVGGVTENLVRGIVTDSLSEFGKNSGTGFAENSVNGGTVDFGAGSSVDSVEGGVKRYRDEIVEALSADSALNADTLEVPGNPDYETRRYRKFSNILNVHSWAPLYYNIDNIRRLSYDNIYDMVSPGFILYSQNNLSTAYMTAGYSWHEGFHSGHLKLSYHGLYPVFELSADVNDRNREKLSIERDFFGIPTQVIDTLKGAPYINARLLTYIPLDYSKGGWNVGLIPSFVWRYTNDSYYSAEREEFSNYHLN